MQDPSAGDARPSPGVPDQHGEAALLLVESLLHALVARSSLTIGEAIEVVQVAVDTQAGISDDRDEPADQRLGVQYLTAIAASLRIDEVQRTWLDGHDHADTDGSGA